MSIWAITKSFWVGNNLMGGIPSSVKYTIEKIISCSRLHQMKSRNHETDNRHFFIILIIITITKMFFLKNKIDRPIFINLLEP